MKKLLTALAAVFALALVGVMSSCVQNDSDKYPELIQYYCCYGDDDWTAHESLAKTLMSYNGSEYEITITTERKNQRFEITKGAGYSIEYMSEAADDETASTFSRTENNGFGGMQTVLPAAGDYYITFNASTEKYHVEAK